MAAREIAHTWWPVRRGFSVTWPDGERGRVDDIRVVDGTVQLIVEADAGRRVAVSGADVEAIMPRRRRIVVAATAGSGDAAGVESAGGIIRMPVRDAWRFERPSEDAA